MRWVRVWLVGFSLCFADFSFASTRDCRWLTLKIRRTLGIEWELEPFKHHDHDQLFKFVSEDFRHWYAPYGRNEKGALVQFLIPSRLKTDWRFAELVSRYPSAFLRVGDSWRVANWHTLDGDTLGRVLFHLINMRGQETSDFVLIRIPEAHDALLKGHGPDHKRFQLPERVAEEWRGNRLVNFEFALRGFVHTRAQARGYLYYLWKFLDWIPPQMRNKSSLLKEAGGHIHWVPDWESVPISMRGWLYERLVHYWANYNLSIYMDYHSRGFSKNRDADGKLILDERVVSDYFYSLWQGEFMQGSFLPLTEATRSRVSVSPGGLLIENREHGLDPDVDPGLPTVFKRLFLGLRAKYDKAGFLPSGNEPIGRVGLEGRGGSNFAQQFNMLPEVKETELVDVKNLSAHSSSSALIDDSFYLKAQAKQLGISKDLVEKVQSFYSPIDVKWPLSTYTMAMLFALQPWEQMFLFRLNAEAMPVTERTQRLKRFQEARQTYVKHINVLLNEPEFSSHEVQVRLTAENFRFVVDSQLSEFLLMPKVIFDEDLGLK